MYFPSLAIWLWSALMNTETTHSNFVTRFAPSPTGYLHKGHAYSALLAYKAARQAGGRFILRIEDIDTGRCKPEFTDTIYEDLAWLGIKWEEPVRIQSEHFDDYQQVLDRLKGQKLVYPCFCTRRDIQTEIAKSPSAPHRPDGPLYPGTCRNLSADERETRIKAGEAHAWRLGLMKALDVTGTLPDWVDTAAGPIKTDPEQLGDIVLARKDTPTSYHLSVVVDDGLQGITHIVRGKDLMHTTHIHVVLQKLLDLPTPTYHHHDLLLDETGQRFAKRNKSATLRSMRENRVRANTLEAELLS